MINKVRIERKKQRMVDDWVDDLLEKTPDDAKYVEVKIKKNIILKDWLPEEKAIRTVEETTKYEINNQLDLKYSVEETRDLFIDLSYMIKSEEVVFIQVSADDKEIFSLYSKELIDFRKKLDEVNKCL